MYVLWLAKPEIKVTWETADSLSPAVIEEFEKGILSEVVTHTDQYCGQYKCLLSVGNKPLEDVAPKNPKIECPVISKSNG